MGGVLPTRVGDDGMWTDEALADRTDRWVDLILVGLGQWAETASKVVMIHYRISSYFTHVLLIHLVVLPFLTILTSRGFHGEPFKRQISLFCPLLLHTFLQHLPHLITPLPISSFIFRLD
jgi:hypothetical protein